MFIAKLIPLEQRYHRVPGRHRRHAGFVNEAGELLPGDLGPCQFYAPVKYTTLSPPYSFWMRTGNRCSGLLVAKQ